MKKNDEFLDAFAKLGASETVSTSIKSSLNKYTCVLYGVKQECKNVNIARLKLLLKKLPQRKGKKNLLKLQSFDPATLPPCMTVLDHKISRVNQVSYIWTNAHQAHITEWDPLQHGWVKEDKTDNLIPKWFEGE